MFAIFKTHKKVDNDEVLGLLLAELGYEVYVEYVDCHDCSYWSTSLKKIPEKKEK